MAKFGARLLKNVFGGVIAPTLSNADRLPANASSPTPGPTHPGGLGSRPALARAASPRQRGVLPPRAEDIRGTPQVAPPPAHLKWDEGGDDLAGRLALHDLSQRQERPPTLQAQAQAADDVLSAYHQIHADAPMARLVSSVLPESHAMRAVDHAVDHPSLEEGPVRAHLYRELARAMAPDAHPIPAMPQGAHALASVVHTALPGGIAPHERLSLAHALADAVQPYSPAQQVRIASSVDPRPTQP